MGHSLFGMNLRDGLRLDLAVVGLLLLGAVAPVAISIATPAATPAFAAEQPGTMRLVVDVTSNHYGALETFLDREGYWPAEKAAVLDPLAGRLSLDHDTAAVRLVRTLDEIPGLRPLPEGVLSFLHGHHNTFYVEVGDDRWLLGISYIYQSSVNEHTDVHLEKFDLISGEYTDLGPARAPVADAVGFVEAHGSRLGDFLRSQLFWVVLLFFLAWRRRRLGSADGDPVVQARRRQVQNRLFLAAGLVWLLQVVSFLGVAHFQAQVAFLGQMSGGQPPDFQDLRRHILQPGRLRLLSLGVSLGLAVLWWFLLGLWSGVLGRRAAPSPTTQGAPLP